MHQTKSDTTASSVKLAINYVTLANSVVQLFHTHCNSWYRCRLWTLDDSNVNKLGTAWWNTCSDFAARYT